MSPIAPSNANSGLRDPKVALVSIGIGRTQRGYERYFTDLFQVLRNEIDITLYKGRGENTDRERVPAFLKTTSLATKLLPLGVVVGGAEYRYYKHDCVAYALTLLPELFGRKYDVVHVIDYPLMRALEKVQKVTKFPGKLLYTNGCCMPPQLYPKVAHVHHVAEPFYREALAWGIPDSRMTLAPCGIHTSRFVASNTRQELRRKYQISEDSFVVLAVTAVKRMHKRVDYLIDEVSRVKGDVLFLVDGHPEDESIADLAREKMGDRCRISHVPSPQVGELYKIADVMVHGSLEESFGLAIVEAMSTGLKVLAHDSPHFQWLLQDRESLVNMNEPGALRLRLQQFCDRKNVLQRSQLLGERTRKRFDWESLRSTYTNMYCKLAGMSAPLAASA